MLQRVAARRRYADGGARGEDQERHHAAEGQHGCVLGCVGRPDCLSIQGERHGIFTYYLLEKLQETKGDVTLGDLYEHLSTNVAQQSVVVNRKVQLPVVSSSAQLSGQWEDMKLK